MWVLSVLLFTIGYAIGYCQLHNVFLATVWLQLPLRLQLACQRFLRSSNDANRVKLRKSSREKSKELRDFPSQYGHKVWKSQSTAAAPYYRKPISNIFITAHTDELDWLNKVYNIE